MKRCRFPLLLALLLAATLGLASCQDDQAETTGGEIGFTGTLTSLESDYAVVALEKTVDVGQAQFSAGSDLRFPVDEAIQQFVAEDGIQVGDAVVGCFLDDTVEAGNPPTVQVVDFALDQESQDRSNENERSCSGTVTRLEQDFITVSLSEDIRYDDYRFPAGTELRTPMDQSVADAIQQEEIQEGDTVDVRYLYGSEALADQEGLPVSVRMVSVHLAD